MTTIIVLAMHGAPPNDFPRQEMLEFFGLHTRLEHAPPGEHGALQQRYAALESKMRAWPRTPENDPFFAASEQLAQELSQASGYDVVFGFNEFCAPDLVAALDEAVDRGAEQVVVITPMMTRGGEHATIDIPNLIKDAQERHRQVEMIYAWPFADSDVAAFLAEQIERFR